MTRFARSRDVLIAQGCSWGTAATPADLANFENTHKLAPHADLRAFYEMCSGWEITNVWLISLWPLDKLNRVTELANSPQFYIGDFMIGSDDIVTDITDPRSPVTLIASDEILAATFTDFLNGLLSGNLEFGP